MLQNMRKQLSGKRVQISEFPSIILQAILFRQGRLYSCGKTLVTGCFSEELAVSRLET